jgi:cation transport ATPase
VIINGSDPNNQTPIDYQALAEFTATSTPTTLSTKTSNMYPPPKVILMMCLFWIISKVSLIGGPFQPLQYVALVSVAIGLPPMARNAVDLLRRQMRFDGNGPVVLATVGAMVLGKFLEAAFLVSLFALSSEWLEKRTTVRARQVVSDRVLCDPTRLVSSILNPTTLDGSRDRRSHWATAWFPSKRAIAFPAMES